MTSSPLALRRGWPPPLAAVALALAALALGAGLTALPLPAAIALLAGAATLIAIAIEPAAGLAVALILGPTKPFTDAYLPALPLDLGQIALAVALGAWFVHAAKRHELRIPRSPLTLPLAVFLAAGLLSLTGALSLGAGLEELIKWAELLLVMWLTVEFAERTSQAEPKVLHEYGRRGKWKFLLGAVLAAALLQALIGIWQFGLRGDGPEHFQILGGDYYRAYGTFEQPNPFGGFLGLALPIAAALVLSAMTAWGRPLWAAIRARRPVAARPVLRAAFSKRLWAVLGAGAMAGLLAMGLIASWSRGAWLGVAAAGAVMLFALPRRAWQGAALLVIAALAAYLALRFNLLPAAIASRLTGFAPFAGTFDVRGVDITDANFSVIERLAHWQAASGMARQHFWLGVGLGNYEVVYPAYALINWPAALGHAHNIYLNMLAETGIIGLAAYLGLWIAVLWQTWRLTRQSTWHGKAMPQIATQNSPNSARQFFTYRMLAIGLLGAWVHLATHQLFDKLLVANLHLHIGVLLGVLSLLVAFEKERKLT